MSATGNEKLERPSKGGSYVREKDGKLTRKAFTMPAAARTDARPTPALAAPAKTAPAAGDSGDKKGS